jgi:ABC-type glycerol-3-phosphate transport system permease component
VLPMGRAAVFLAIIFYFITAWNDLFTPMIFLQKMDKRTVMVALATLMGRYTGAPTLQFAGLLLSAVPALAVYIMFQRQIIRGLSVGAIK